MKPFLQRHGKEVEWSEEPEDLATRTARVSRHSTAEATVVGGKVKISRIKSCGRNAEFEWDCRFCGEQLRTEGFINDHYSKSHKKEGKQSHLPRSPKELRCFVQKVLAVVDENLRPFGKVQVCPVPECREKLVEAEEGGKRAYVCPVPNCTA